MKLIVFPTSRSLRYFKEKYLNKNAILPKLITIDEFEKKVVYVPDKKSANEDTRVIFLKEAADFKEFKKLKFDDEFFKFIRNSSYFFRFFEELEREKVSLKDLKSADIYAEFYEHIEILSHLKKRYENLLEENALFDAITLPSQYQINRNFLKNFSEIVIKLEGFLTNFELDFLEEASKVVDIKIEFKLNRFNEKMAEKFKKRFGLEFESGYEYELNISKKSFKKKERLKESVNAKFISFANRISQIAYIKKKIDDFIKEEIEPEKIAVVLPDENFKNYLNLFDDLNNLNFAMGFDFSNTRFFKVLAIFEESLKASNIKTLYEIDRFEIKDIVAKYREKNRVTFEEFEELIRDFYRFAKDEEKEIVEEELKDFSYLFSYIKDYPLKMVLHLFLNRLRDKKIEDKSGGKVTVLGLLESRGVEFEAVIVPDFNEGVVPKPSQKDMFLDSKLRKNANLPTKKDRENLQKYYYFELFRKAKYIAITYVEDEINTKSRFLDELKGLKKENYSSSDINGILINYKDRGYEEKEIVLEYDFSKQKLSATKLRDFLECPRRYYYKYIKKIDEFEIPSFMPKSSEVGSLLHEALRVLYKREKSYEDVKAIEKDFKEIVNLMVSQKSIYIKFEIDIWIKKLKEFFEKEVERFKDGVRVYEVETQKRKEFNGFELEGKIDRIDFYRGSYQIIDYKSSSVKKPSKKDLDDIKDFQLTFYYLLSKDLGEIEGLYLYDLNSAKMIKEPFLSDKIEILKSILDSLKKKEIDFKKCEDIKYCRFCPYKIICNRV